MPIRPENLSIYPGGSIRSPEWLAIRERIRARAGNRCEACGVENHAVGGRMSDGTFCPALPLDGYAELPKEGAMAWCFDQTDPSKWKVRLRIIKIVCTVAHVDGRLDDHGDHNLAFWCQRCHNRHDAKSRQENATITRHEKDGQLDLLGRST